MSIPFLREDHLPHGAVQDIAPGIRRIVCANPGPFTFRGTNTYLIGRGEVAVLDPGPADSTHLAAILRATAGERITRILVSHTHRDHSPGAAALVAATGAVTFGHGPPLPDPAPFVAALAAHRREREAKVFHALRAARRATAAELVPPVYGPELDAKLVPAAARSLLAHLIKLAAEGAAAREGDAFEAR